MQLLGLTGTLTDKEKAALTQLPYDAGGVFKIFKTARSGATVLVLDVITGHPERNKPHVVKIQDVRQGNVEKQRHEAASKLVPNEFMPTLVEHVSDLHTSLSIIVYEVAGASVLSIRPLSYYLESDVACAEIIVDITVNFLKTINPFLANLRNRRTMGALELCKEAVNHEKNRLDGANGLAARLESVFPGIATRLSVTFDEINEIFPNPVAYIYATDFWREIPLICPFGPVHGDLHSDNLLWLESEKRLSVIDWTTFSNNSPAFLDYALLEIDIIHRSLDCYNKRDWNEWNNISKFLGSALSSYDEAPKGALAVQLWRLIKPIRKAVFDQIQEAENELREIFFVAYFLILYSQTLALLRNQHIPSDRKIGLLLLSARYLNRALSGLGVEWQAKEALVIPTPYELGMRVQSIQPGRTLELAYLDELLNEWGDYSRLYTALGGETSTPQGEHSARVGVKMDLFYEILEQRQEQLVSGLPSKPYQIADVLQEILYRRRVALLGDPGAGKSFTLWQLAHTLAQEARRDVRAPIPVIVPLGGYSGETQLLDFIEHSTAGHIRKLRSEIGHIANEGRLAFLLDGVNEMGGIDRRAGYNAIEKLASAYPNSIFVITCRSAEYPTGISLDQITIRPLTPLRIKTFLQKLLGDEAGEQLFWQLVDKDFQGRDMYWARFKLGGGSEEDFWLSQAKPQGVSDPWNFWDWEFWIKIRDSVRNYLTLAKNPYMLSMIAATYRATGNLPANRGGLFKLFVDSLMAREKEKGDPSTWIGELQQYAALSRLAYTAQRDHLGTSFERAYAMEKLGTAGLLDLAQRENILERVSGKIAFTHQLLQEFFAAYAFDRERLEKNLPATDFWPRTEWWKPVGLEETSVILAGIYQKNPHTVLEWLRDANPELAARCVVDGGITISPEFRQLLIAAWLPRLTNIKEPILARAAIGRALGLIHGDIRPGVTYVDDKTKLPRFEWAHVSGGTCIQGSGASTREVHIEDFRVSKYLITNAQYSVFVKDGGYTSDWKKCWTETGWVKKGDARNPTDYSETLVLPNHPRIGVNWFEAVAFCRWLDQRLHELGELPQAAQVRLPTENEWEKLARGTDGRNFPWGNQFSSELCNVMDIEGTTAVGIFPNGASPYGVCDVVGNAWKWCLTKWNPDELAPEDNSIDGDSPRCYRGGSWGSNLWRTEPWLAAEIECHRRHWIIPEDDRPDAIGFFVVVGKRLY